MVSIIRNWWDLVMDPEQNPLQRLPRMVKFQLMMYLSVLWCMIFTVWTGWIMFLGPSMAAHVIILIGVFFTAKIFHDASDPRPSHRDLYKDDDGCVKYDDIWGG